MDEVFEKPVASREEVQTLPKPVVRDPKELFNLFRESQKYKEEEKRFFEGKNMGLLVTPEEQQEAFEGYSENIEKQLTDFIQQDVDFMCSESFFRNIQLDDGSVTHDPYNKLKEYLDFRQQYRDLNSQSYGSTQQNQDYIQKQDVKRRMLHNRAADSFVQHGIAPNRKFGRVLIEAIAGGLKQGKGRMPTEFESIVKRLGGRGRE